MPTKGTKTAAKPSKKAGTKIKEPQTPKKSKKVKAPEKPKKVYEVWAELFATNERVAKAKKLTDPELTDAITSIFPEKKGRTTLTNVRQVRCYYNNGIVMFAKLGKPDGSKGHPVSNRYLSGGVQVPYQPRKKAEKVAESETKVAEKSAKKTIKKATKKSAKK